MSRHKTFLPGTFVVGSKMQTDTVDGRVVPKIGIPTPLMTAAGKPVGTKPIRPNVLFDGGKVLGSVVHWRSEAARRRWNGDPKAAYADKTGIKVGKVIHYGKSDLVVVPVMRGVPARLANELRADHVRRQTAERKKTIRERLREAIQNVKDGVSNMGGGDAAVA